MLAIKHRLAGSACRADRTIIVFYFLVTISFLSNINALTAVLFSKFSTYVTFYFFGRLFVADSILGKRIGTVALICLVLFTLASFAGIGFVSWGGVRTFVGGYFYKTDL